MKIVVLDGFSVNPGDMTWGELETLGDVTIYDRTAAADVVERCRGAQIVLTNKVAITDAEMAQLPDLRMIGILATGYNIVDTAAARRRGITVSNVPGYSTQSVAQQAIALLLTITNHVEEYSMENREGRWSRCRDFCYWMHPLTELDGKTIGIVGYGHIGRAVARIAAALGMKVAVCSSRPQEELPEVVKMDLDELFSKSDVVSLHCPLTSENARMVNRERLALMKPTAILINTARGGLIDEQALADALDSGRIYAAGLDVMTQEPPKEDNPLLGARNCFITPHIAWATVEARRRLVDIVTGNVKNFLAGKPSNVVN